jgi:hypothetical protein
VVGQDAARGILFGLEDHIRAVVGSFIDPTEPR